MNTKLENNIDIWVTIPTINVKILTKYISRASHKFNEIY